MLSITRKFEFCYGHYLPEYKGKCANQHGHNAVLEVSVRDSNKHVEVDMGANGVYSGMIMDFGELKQIGDHIINELDHQNLNELSAFEFSRPTCELIVLHIVRQFKSRLPKTVALHKVVLTETSNSFATWEE